MNYPNMYPRCSVCNGIIMVVAGKLISGRIFVDKDTKEITYICEACYERASTPKA